MESAEPQRDASGWLEPVVASVLSSIPARQTVDVRSVTRLVLLLGRQADIAVGAPETEAAIVAACLEQGRPVAL